VAKDWPQFDVTGFAQVEVIMVEFGHSVFCEYFICVGVKEGQLIALVFIYYSAG
jgi:hypothetical protein